MKASQNVCDPQGDLVEQRGDFEVACPDRDWSLDRMVKWIDDVRPEEDSTNHRAIAIFRSWLVPRVRTTKAAAKRKKA